MPSVRIKNAEFGAQLFELRTGSNRFGRSPANDIQIEHPSVSSIHCEIILEKDSVRLRDLGSTNGTFLEGKKINESSLEAGRTFKLGVVEFVLEAGSVGLLNQNLPNVCLRHPRTAATAACPKCGQSFCDFCVTTRVVTSVMKKFCRRCGSECKLVNIDPVLHQTDDARALALLVNALRYPIQRDGWVLLLGGALLVFLIDVATAGFSQGSPATAAFALLIAALACGYFFAFLQRIITTTTLGEDQMPGWPDFTEVWQDMIQPFRLLWGLFVACFGPALICWNFAFDGSDLAERALVPLVIAGFLYLPMALLGVAMSDSL
ncbi:MAG: FHA domain-containing protein [Verrucomicrobiota bacterium]